MDNPFPIQRPAPEVYTELASEAMKDRKNGKAAVMSVVVSRMLMTSGDDWIGVLTSLTNSIIREGKTTTDLQKSDALDRGRGLKMFDLVMKGVEKVLEKRLGD